MANRNPKTNQPRNANGQFVKKDAAASQESKEVKRTSKLWGAVEQDIEKGKPAFVDILFMDTDIERMNRRELLKAVEQIVNTARENTQAGKEWKLKARIMKNWKDTVYTALGDEAEKTKKLEQRINDLNQVANNQSDKIEELEKGTEEKNANIDALMKNVKSKIEKISKLETDLAAKKISHDNDRQEAANKIERMTNQLHMMDGTIHGLRFLTLAMGAALLVTLLILILA